jgi:hypothetical protein
MLVSWNMASFGRLDEAEAAARSSIERFDAAGEVLLVVNSLNALAGIIAAKGDIEGASVAYEALLGTVPGHRAAPLPALLPSSLSLSCGPDKVTTPPPTISTKRRSGALSTRGCQPTPWSAKPPSPVASVTWPGREALLDTAADRYRDADLPAGQARVLAGLAWWALGAGQPDAAIIFAADAVRAAETIGDPETQLLADSALAAAKCDR